MSEDENTTNSTTTKIVSWIVVNYKLIITSISLIAGAWISAYNYIQRINALEQSYTLHQVRCEKYYRTTDSLVNIINYQNQSISFLKGKADRDSNFINLLYDYKQPYDKWGNK